MYRDILAEYVCKLAVKIKTHEYFERYVESYEKQEFNSFTLFHIVNLLLRFVVENVSGT